MEVIRKRESTDPTPDQLERLNVYLFEAEREAEHMPNMEHLFANIRSLRIPIVRRLAALHPEAYRVPEPVIVMGADQ